MSQQFDNLPAALKAIAKDVRRRARALDKAIKKTARHGASYIKENTVPVAFGELRDSIHAVDIPGGATIVCDAPYAAAVELGSRPHMVPLDAIVRWIKKRGAEGMTAGGKVRAAPKNPNKARRLEPSRAVAHMLISMQKAPVRNFTGTGYRSGEYMDADAPIALAKAIQAKIARSGTKPHHFMRKAIPHINDQLDRFIKEALRYEAEFPLG